MALLVLIAVILIASAGGLVARAAALPRLRISSQLRQIDTYGFHSTERGVSGAAERQPFSERLSALAARIGRACAGRGIMAPTEARTLRAAGMYAINPDTFHGYRVMASAGIPAFLMLEGLLTGSLSGTIVLLAVAAAVICWFLPPALVKTRAQARMDQVDRSLPELIDVLTATVEAGLGFAGSLQLVSARFDGPLGQELRLMLQEQSMGLSTERALSNLVDRCDTPSVRAFARAVTQGEALGVSIGAMLRNLASETRKRRRQRAREQIMKAPVKMLFPLVFLIFPALLIVLLYPAATNLLHALGQH